MNKHVLLSIFLMLIGSTTMASKLESLKVKGDENRATIMCSYVGQAKHKVFTLSKPNRLVVDFENSTMAVEVRKVTLKNKLITSIRGGRSSQGTSRLVFDLKHAVTVKTSEWTPEKAGENGLRIDLFIRPK